MLLNRENNLGQMASQAAGSGSIDKNVNDFFGYSLINLNDFRYPNSHKISNKKFLPTH